MVVPTGVTNISVIGFSFTFLDKNDKIDYGIGFVIVQNMKIEGNENYMDAYKIRQARAYESLRSAGIEKALIGDPLSMIYLTGIHIIPYERFYGMVVDAQAETITMVNPSVDTGCMKGTMTEVTYLDTDGPAGAIASVVGKSKNLAVEIKYYSMYIGNILYSLGTEIIDIGDALNVLRMHKDEKELEYMQTAADIVDKAVAYVSDKIHVGMTENQLNKMLFDYMCTYEGFNTDEVIILVLAAENSANCHGHSTDYAFKEGDIILMDFCAYYNRYWSDITRCLFLGHVGNPKLAEIYEIVKGANLAAIATVKPGVPAKEVDKAARDYITERGYGEYFIHRTGHGLGLSVHEEPYITGVNELILREGMTFTIEPGIYLAGVGGVRIEDDMLVTKDGAITLTHCSKELADHIIKI